jgi:hypothetical protein
MFEAEELYKKNSEWLRRPKPVQPGKVNLYLEFTAGLCCLRYSECAFHRSGLPSDLRSAAEIPTSSWHRAGSDPSLGHSAGQSVLKNAPTSGQS